MTGTVGLLDSLPTLHYSLSMVRLPSTARLHPDLGLRAAAIPEECAAQVWQRAHHRLTRVPSASLVRAQVCCCCYCNGIIQVVPH